MTTGPTINPTALGHHIMLTAALELTQALSPDHKIY